jgi:hypothetical protein
MAFPKYQTKEVLNKVLNAGEDALKIDIDNVTLDGSQLSVDIDNANDSIVIFSNTAADGSGTNTVPLVDAAGHLQVDVLTTTANDSIVTLGDTAYTEATSKGTAIGGVRNDSLSTLADTENEWSPLQVNASGALYVDGSDATQPVSGTVSVSGLLADGHNVTIDNTDSNEVYVRGSGTAGSADAKVLTVQGISSGTPLAVTESSPISGFATSGNQLAAGHTIDCNSTFVKLKDGSGTAVTSTSGKLDVCLHSEDGTAINETSNALDVNIASGGFGGVVTNGGTFAVQVDGSALTALQLIDDTVATLGTTTYSETSTKGNVVGAVRNDTLATLADTDNEIAPLQVNKSGALYTVEETGQLGAIYESGTTAVSGEQIIAIQFLEDTKFTTLTPASAAFIGTASGDGDNIVNTEVFPQGMTIFGRWTAFTLVTGGRVIAYKGVW